MADRFLPLGFEKPEKVVASLRRAGNNDDSCSRGSDAIRAHVSPESGTRCGLPFLVSVNRHPIGEPRSRMLSRTSRTSLRLIPRTSRRFPRLTKFVRRIRSVSTHVRLRVDLFALSRIDPPSNLIKGSPWRSRASRQVPVRDSMRRRS